MALCEETHQLKEKLNLKKKDLRLAIKDDRSLMESYQVDYDFKEDNKDAAFFLMHMPATGSLGSKELA